MGVGNRQGIKVVKYHALMNDQSVRRCKIGGTGSGKKMSFGFLCMS